MLNIELNTPYGISWNIKSYSISIPGIMGRFQILPNHINIISITDIGEIYIYKIIKMQMNFEMQILYDLMFSVDGKHTCHW